MRKVDVDLVQELIAELNELGEHTRIEAKTASELGKSVLHTICAFSNEPDLGGGHILLGVARESDPDLFDRRPYRVVGVPDPEKISSDLATKCATEFSRPIRPRITPVSISGQTVLHVAVEEAKPQDKPIVLNRFGSPRGVFRRTSEGDFHGTEDDLALFYSERGRDTFDRRVMRQARATDIDPDAIRIYRRLLEDSGRSAEVLEFTDDELLEALGAVEPNGGAPKPTAAGILLFGTRVALRREFAMMRVDYLRVPGTEWVEDADRRYDALIEIRDPLFRALLRAENAVVDDLPKKFHLPEGKLQRQDILSFPRKALREAIVNALMHRDYQAHGPIQIIRFADRIEIHNPGYSIKPAGRLGLPGSATRNPTIASAFFDTDLAETKGTGIRTMRTEMERAELAPPTFESDREANTFVARLPLVHFLSDDDRAWLTALNVELDQHKRVVLVHVRDEGRIDNEGVRGMTGLDVVAASNLLAYLCKVDLLSKHGKARATYYLPSERFFESLPTGVIPPGFEGKTRMSGTKPSMSDGKSHLSGTKSHMSDGKPSMSDGKPSMSGTKPSMLPAELVAEIEELGAKAHENDLRRILRRICAHRPYSALEIGEFLDRSPVYLKTRYLKPMVAEGLLALTIPDKPRSRNQKYRASS